VSTYRLVNVSVKPAGRCGAPQTEPGRSWRGRWLDAEFMTISCSEGLAALVG